MTGAVRSAVNKLQWSSMLVTTSVKLRLQWRTVNALDVLYCWS